MWGELLPIGSVVLLRDSEKRLMVMGFCQAKPEDTSVVYDYCGCLYPEGYIDADNVYLFNHEQIEEVYSIGYMDAEQFLFREKVSEVLYNLKSGGDLSDDAPLDLDLEKLGIEESEENE